MTGMEPEPVEHIGESGAPAECKCCGRKTVHRPALVCTLCIFTDPEAQAWLALEQAASGRTVPPG